MDTHHDTCRCIIDPVDGMTVGEMTEIDSGLLVLLPSSFSGCQMLKVRPPQWH